MNLYAWVLIVALAVAALADWRAVARDDRDIESIAKPGVLGLLILLAWLLHADTVSYGRALLLGLVLSLVGDVLLLGRTDRHFLAGLLAFLGAHAAYIAAFRRIPADEPLWGGVILVVAAGLAALWVLVRTILRGLSAEGVLVAVYAVVIVAMGALAWATGHLVLAVGATLFLVSDALIGIDRFARPVPHGRLAVMVTYHLGQLLIVLGMLRA